MEIIEVKHTYEVQDFYIRFPHCEICSKNKS